MDVPRKRRAVHVTLAVVLIPVLALLVWRRHERLTQPRMFVEDGALVVQTRGREVYPIAAMSSVSLEARMPEVLGKDEGLARGGRLSGRFTLRGLGSARVVVNTAVPPYLLIRTADGFLLLNFPEPARTRALYEQLLRDSRRSHGESSP